MVQWVPECIDRTVRRLTGRLAGDSVKLDDDALTALVGYTFDNGRYRESSIYFAFNQALRGRVQDPATFGTWQVRLFSVGLRFLLLRVSHSVCIHRDFYAIMLVLMPPTGLPVLLSSSVGYAAKRLGCCLSGLQNAT